MEFKPSNQSKLKGMQKSTRVTKGRKIEGAMQRYIENKYKK